MSGVFITFEGCEGVGKTTQLHLLKKYLNDTNQQAIFTREPGGTPLAEEIRSILLSKDNSISPIVEAYLFATARACHMEEVILPHLDKGYIVVCDRFLDSSLAYQGKARGLGMDRVMEINKHALADRLPDCTIFLDMKPQNSWRKQLGKKIHDDRLEQESDSFHSLVYDGFKELERDNDRLVAVVPNNDRMVTHASIVAVLREKGLIG